MSRKMAFSKVIDSDILENPNNILAIEYIKASMALNYNVKFKTLQRIGDYHSTETIANYASATAIRQMITANEDYSQFVPRNTISLYENADTFNLSNLDNTIIYLLRSCKCRIYKRNKRRIRGAGKCFKRRRAKIYRYVFRSQRCLRKKIYKNKNIQNTYFPFARN